MSRVGRGHGPGEKPDPMDVDKVLKCLNEALELQHRSILQFNLASGSMFGLEVQAVTARPVGVRAGRARRHAPPRREDRGARRRSTTAVAPVTWNSDPAKVIDPLIECEDEAIAALHAVIPYSGQEPRSEALEHLMEHLIMRKQNQVDWLRRARREP